MRDRHDAGLMAVMPVTVIVAILLVVIALIQHGGFFLLAGSTVSIYYWAHIVYLEWDRRRTQQQNGGQK